MPREKNYKKKHHTDATNADENKNEQSTSQLFSEADAKYVEASGGYTLGYGAPQAERIMSDHAIPTGVVEIDESVKLPKSPSKSHHQHPDAKPYTVLRPSENAYKEDVHLPPIFSYPYHHHYQYPYGNYHSLSDYHNSGHLSYPYPVHHDHHSPYHHHRHHRHHHHHHHHHHHKHEKEVETYDPRWWYMPVNTVHAPKPWLPPQYTYSPPKWYESPSRPSRMSMNSQEPKLSPRKYVDCRCEVCRPSKGTPIGTKWIVNE